MIKLSLRPTGSSHGVKAPLHELGTDCRSTIFIFPKRQSPWLTFLKIRNLNRAAWNIIAIFTSTLTIQEDSASFNRPNQRLFLSTCDTELPLSFIDTSGQVSGQVETQDPKLSHLVHEASSLISIAMHAHNIY